LKANVEKKLSIYNTNGNKNFQYNNHNKRDSVQNFDNSGNKFNAQINKYQASKEYNYNNHYN